MSAYGEIVRLGSSKHLPATSWNVPGDTNSNYIAINHLTIESTQALSGLVEYLHKIFSQEIETGMTYPQEGEISQTGFEKYFFGADVFVGITCTGSGKAIVDGAHVQVSIDTQRAGRPWEDCISGFYYIKPNYPGRSSHICNAGFMVPPKNRGKGYGGVLAKSYVHYAPLLGYQASVFNLVYTNNTPSVKLWENLGFAKVGRIPRAGRLRTSDGLGEEYVDAWVIYKSFETEGGRRRSRKALMIDSYSSGRR